MQKPDETVKLSRRGVVISAAGSAALLAGMANWAQADMKVSQSAVHYQAAPKDGQDCGHCYQFVAPKSCRIVNGEIAPTGWCRLWVKKTG